MSGCLGHHSLANLFSSAQLLEYGLGLLGESFPVAGLRANLEGWINAPIPVFWNVGKK